MPASIKRMDEKHLMEIDELLQNNLLNTIRIPKNLHFLTERLPKPNYTPMKIKKVDKHKFLQTLAGYKDSSLNVSLVEDNLMKIGSESVDSRKKQFKEVKNLGNIHLPPLQAYGSGINNSNKENNDILKIYAVHNEKGKERPRIHSLNKQNLFENIDKNMIQVNKNNEILSDQTVLKLDIKKIEEKEKSKSPEKIKKDDNSPILGNLGYRIHENGKEFIYDKHMVNVKNIYGSNSIKKLNELSPIKGNHALLNENVLSSKKLKKIGSKNHEE